MAEYDNTNRGVLFENDRKETDKHPDMTGSLNINGVDHWFSGWWKEGRSGEFLSLSIGKPKEAKGAAPAPQQQTSRRGSRSTAPAVAAAPARSGGGFDDMDDDIPF